MAKKQKKATPERVPTKRQLSKWQREEKIRRIAIIASVVFLAGILSWVGYGYYKDYKNDPMREVVIKVNGVAFTMEYFVDMFDIYTKGVESSIISSWSDYLGDIIANQIINGELARQAAKNLGIEVTSAEIKAELKARELPDDRVYRDVIGNLLLQERLKDYFGSQLPGSMEQAHVEVMLVESEEVADKVRAEVGGGGNFTALVVEFSCNSSVEGDLGWLPEELMPNTLIADAAFNLTLGVISQPIYDEIATKEVGYWLIKVTDKQDGKINALVMLLGSKAEAERVKAELAAGGNFSALAKEYSQHESKTNGGKLDGLKRGDMGSTVFDQVAFNITINEVSEPVKDESAKTVGGYWLVKVLDRGERELDEETKEKLINKRLNDLLEERKKNSTIDNLLTTQKKSWAANRVVRRR